MPSKCVVIQSFPKCSYALFCTESLANISLVIGHGRTEYAQLVVIVADSDCVVGRPLVADDRPMPPSHCVGSEDGAHRPQAVNRACAIRTFSAAPMQLTPIQISVEGVAISIRRCPSLPSSTLQPRAFNIFRISSAFAQSFASRA